MTLPRLLAPFLALACTLPAFAGMEKESHSTRGGLFFAMLTPDVERVLASFDKHAPLQQLAQHCNTGKAVFALQTGAKYQCKAEVFKNASGADEWESVGVTVQGLARQSDRREYGLFSLTPPATPRHRRRHGPLPCRYPAATAARSPGSTTGSRAGSPPDRPARPAGTAPR